MATKSLPDNEAARARELLRQVVRDDFDNNQSEAKRQLGLSQSQISDVISGKRGAGNVVLKALSKHTGRSTDDILGRPVVTQAAATPFEAGRRRFAERAALLQNPAKVERFLADIADDPSRLLGFKADLNLLQIEDLFEDAFRLWREQEDIQGAKLQVRHAPVLEDGEEDEYEVEMAKRTADEAKAAKTPLAKGARVGARVSPGKLTK